mgnify:CR=1 FL=1
MSLRLVLCKDTSCLSQYKYAACKREPQVSVQDSVRISAKNFGFENKIKSVPLYVVFCMKRELADAFC